MSLLLRLLRLSRPTRRQVHIAWLIVAFAISLVFTHGTFFILTLGLFFVVWVLGFGVIVRYYR